jgi:plastocyanin
MIPIVLGLALSGASELTLGEDLQGVMARISLLLQQGEQQAQSADYPSLRGTAKGLLEISGRIPDLAMAGNPSRSDDIRQLTHELDQRLSMVQTFASAGNGPAAQWAFGQVRHQCVTCHLRVRSDNESRGPYPSAGGVIQGTVRLVRQEGEPRSSHDDVVVFLDGMAGVYQPPPVRPHVSQTQRQFSPAVLPILKGTTVDFPNDDDIFHNVFSLSRCCPFDLGIYGSGTSQEITFAKTGLAKIHCNIHPEMISHVLVLANPFFATTQEDGFFVITDVPGGEFSLRTWHEFGGDQKLSLQMTGTDVRFLHLEIKEDRRRVGHKNKFGRPYGGKYR